MTGTPVELLWVKGSGGDLGTLTEAGLAVLRLDRLRALVDVYPGVEREDEMVAAFDYCLHGRGGAAPSIDTAMHGLVDAAHVDHLHPDSGIALATAADGEALTRALLRRPRRLGRLAPARVPARPRHRRDPARQPEAIGAILGGHGITAWGDTLGGVRGALARDHPDGRAVHRRARPRRSRSGRRSRATSRSPRRSGTRGPPRCCRSSAAWPRPTGRRSATTPTARSSSTSSAGREHPRLAALGTSCPDHFLRTKVRPMVLDLPPTADLADVVARLRELHAAYRDDYAAYYERHATPDSPPMRGADPAIVLVPGVGMFIFGANKQTARVAGEFYVNAINVMRGAEALSTYAPIAGGGEVPDRVLGARGGEARADARSRGRSPRGSRS